MTEQRQDQPVGDPRSHSTRLSVVIPVYNGASSIGPLVASLMQHLASLYDLEIVLINDSSPDDDSEQVCRRLAMDNPPVVRFINLARNFGEHNAVMAGLTYCTGDVAVIMDDDFQNPPSEVIKLVTRLQEGDDCDVVYSRYETKKHHWFRNVGSSFNNLVASYMLKKPRGLYLSSFKAINRFAIDEIIKYTGPFPYIDGLIWRITRRFDSVLVAHDQREEGESGYTLTKLVRLWLNMFTNFSILPLRLASLGGVAFAGLGFIFAISVVIERISNPELPVGWSSTMCIILVVSGVQLVALGMIGEYLGRLFLKDNGSPQFVIRETVGCGDGSDTQPEGSKA